MISLDQIVNVCKGQRYVWERRGNRLEIAVHGTPKGRIMVPGCLNERFIVVLNEDRTHFVAYNEHLPDGWVALATEDDVVDFDNHLQATQVALRPDMKH